MNKPRLFLLTSAITRGPLHTESIGQFYKHSSIQLLNELYDIIHIIHIDYPIKLRNNLQFSVNDTKQLFSNIIPAYVQTIFIDGPTEEPSFAKAYTTLLSTMSTFKLSRSGLDIVWWMEDDWRPTIDYNYASVLNKCFQPSHSAPTAVTLTNNSPLCSFRGGPIMNMSFFIQLFDIFHTRRVYGIGKNETKLINNLNFNPEEKVSRNIRMNRTISQYSGHIYSICIFILSESKFPYTFRPHHPWYYDKKITPITKFNQSFGMRYITAFLDTPESRIIRYTHEYVNIYEMPPISHQSDIDCLPTADINQFNINISNAGINYITIVPFVFVDIGRQFNADNGVVTFANK